MTTVLKAKKELLATKVSKVVSDTNENLLRVNISKFFTDLEAEIQKALMEYWNDTMLLQGHINLILAPLHEKQREYYELLLSHKLDEFHRGEAKGKRLVKRATKKVAMKAAKPIKFTHNKNTLFGTLQYTEDKLARDTFTASETTLNRVDSNIQKILTDGYRSGAGINEVSRQITERFDQLRTWEATRIARTEIHTAQNMGVMSSYESLGVNYTMWVSAHDARTRRSHLDLDGEIIPFGGTYSNGLAYPGDKSGDIREWINCRCSNAPFVIPPGMMAPSFSPFREEDLIPIETEPTVAEPQQMGNLNSNQDLLGNGDYHKYAETNEQGRELTVYKFENVEIAIEKGSKFTVGDMVEHINALPKELVNASHVKRIDIFATECTVQEHSWGDRVGGLYHSEKQWLRVYKAETKSKEYIKDIFNHEFGHSIDLNKKGVNTLAGTKEYHLIVQADNIHGVENPTKLDKKMYKAPTKYAGESYIREMNGEHSKRRYTEDIAESTALYLSPKSHDKFVKEFPNRAEYFEKKYGKPNFKNIKYEDKGVLQESVKIDYDLKKLEEKYNHRIKEIDNQIELLKETRRTYSKKRRDAIHNNSKEEINYWELETSKVRTEIKQLEKVQENLYDKHHEVFQAIMKKY